MLQKDENRKIAALLFRCTARELIYQYIKQEKTIAQIGAKKYTIPLLART